MKKPTLKLFVASMTFVTACAQQPDQVTKSYVSPSTYAHLSCNQLRTERVELVNHVNMLTGKQKKKADSDAAMMAVGIVLFWPALFALSAGKDSSAELASAKGQYEAIVAAGASKGCFTA